MSESAIYTVKLLYLTSFGLGKSAFWGRIIPIILFCLPLSYFFNEIIFELSLISAVILASLFIILWDEELALTQGIKIFPSYIIGALLSLANPFLVYHIYWTIISLVIYFILDYTELIKIALKRFPNSRSVLLTEGISNGILSMLISHMLIMTLNLVGLLHFIGAI